MAVAYGIPKGDIVLSKMDGTAGEDLWISHFAARKAHLNSESLLAAKEKALTWKNALDERKVPLAAPGSRFREHLLRGDDVSLLAALATCETVADRLGTSWKDLEPLLLLSASTGEIVTATLLERWTGRKGATIYADVRSGNTTWDRQMHQAGVSPGKVEDAIRKLIR